MRTETKRKEATAEMMEIQTGPQLVPELFPFQAIDSGSAVAGPGSCSSVVNDSRREKVSKSRKRLTILWSVWRSYFLEVAVLTGNGGRFEELHKLVTYQEEV